MVARYVKQNPMFRGEYEKNKDFIDSQLSFVGVRVE